MKNLTLFSALLVLMCVSQVVAEPRRSVDISKLGDQSRDMSVNPWSLVDTEPTTQVNTPVAPKPQDEGIKNKADNATKMKACYTLPLALIWKGKFLDRGCTYFVDDYAQINQAEVDKIKQDKSLTSEIKETPFYRATDSEQCDMNRNGEMGRYYERLTARILAMEKEKMNRQYKELWMSDFSCETTARKIDQDFEEAEKYI